MKKLISTEDLFKINFLNRLSTHPNSKYAVFTKVTQNINKNLYSKKIFKINLDTLKITAVPKSSKYIQYIWIDQEILLCSYKKANDDSTYFDTLNIQTNQIEYTFSIPYSVNSIFRLKNNEYFFTAEVNTNYSNLKQPKEELDYILIKELPFWDNGMGYVSGIRNMLFHYNPTIGKCNPITANDFNVSKAELNTDKTKLYYTGHSYTQKKPDKVGLYCVNAESLVSEEIINQDCFSISNLQFSGNNLFVAATDNSKLGSLDKKDWYILNENNLTKIKENDYTIGCNIATDCRYGSGNSTAELNNNLIYLSTEGYKCVCNHLDTKGNINKNINFDGAIDGIAVHKDKIIFTGMEKDSLQEIYIATENSYKKISDFNNEIYKNFQLSDTKYFGFENSDGINLDGWVLYPADYNSKKTYPALLSIHGGPCVAFGEIFNHEMQMLASKGYFVFYCNPRGSDGKGAEFSDIRGKYGEIDFADFMEFTDYITSKIPQIDKTKLGVLGGSYGGFMTNWIIGNTNKFAAAVSQRSFCNPISDFGNSCIGYSFDTEQFQATPWSDLDKLWQHAPLKYAPNVETPTLFIHSLEDYNCPLSQGFEMFTALKYHGVKSEMLLFKGENHELSRSGQPLHRQRRLNAIESWFNENL